MPENKDELDLFARGDLDAGSVDEAIEFPVVSDDPDLAVTTAPGVEDEQSAPETVSPVAGEDSIAEDSVEEIDPALSGAQEVVPDESDALTMKNPLPVPEIETLEDFGAYLRRVRKAENLSVAAVAAETRIRENYIEALENGDGAELPPGVFVLAYARKLCRLYGIDIDKMADVVELLRNKVAYELPNDLSKVVGSGEIDEAELRRRNHLALAFAALFSLIVLAVISGIVLLIVFLGGGSSAPLTESEIVRMQGQPALNSDRLPVPGSKTGQKR